MDALENLNKVNAADKDLVVRWYNLSADENRNPEHLVNLSTQGREQFALMAELFGDIESKVMKDLLRFYISAVPATRNSELFKFHLIDKLLGSGFNIKLENFKYDNFKRPLYFPEFSTHFDPEHLSSFRFIDIFTTNPSFRTYFLSIMTQQLIDNLDERYNRYLENSQQGVADLYTYETYLEDIYLDLILNGFFDKSTIVQWLGIYPFRLMNEKGDTVPDNFYKSFQGHIVENNTAEYLDFFKQLKLIKKGNHSTHEVFMKDYDSHATTRSVLFREDFYFMNSLYFRGAQLKRSFWIQLDSILQSSPDKRYIGEYLSKVQLVDECCSKDMPKSKLESFYNEMLTLFPIDKQDELEILKVATQRETLCETPEQKKRVEKPHALDYNRLYNAGLELAVQYVDGEYATTKNTIQSTPAHATSYTGSVHKTVESIRKDKELYHIIDVVKEFTVFFMCGKDYYKFSTSGYIETRQLLSALESVQTMAGFESFVFQYPGASDIQLDTIDKLDSYISNTYTTSDAFEPTELVGGLPSGSEFTGLQTITPFKIKPNKQFVEFYNSISSTIDAKLFEELINKLYIPFLTCISSNFRKLRLADKHDMVGKFVEYIYTQSKLSERNSIYLFVNGKFDNTYILIGSLCKLYKVNATFLNLYPNKTIHAVYIFANGDKNIIFTTSSNWAAAIKHEKTYFIDNLTVQTIVNKYNGYSDKHIKDFELLNDTKLNTYISYAFENLQYNNILTKNSLKKAEQEFLYTLQHLASPKILQSMLLNFNNVYGINLSNKLQETAIIDTIRTTINKKPIDKPMKESLSALAEHGLNMTTLLSGITEVAKQTMVSEIEKAAKPSVDKAIAPSPSSIFPKRNEILYSIRNKLKSTNPEEDIQIRYVRAKSANNLSQAVSMGIDKLIGKTLDEKKAIKKHLFNTSSQAGGAKITKWRLKPASILTRVIKFVGHVISPYDDNEEEDEENRLYDTKEDCEYANNPGEYAFSGNEEPDRCDSVEVDESVPASKTPRANVHGKNVDIDDKYSPDDPDNLEESEEIKIEDAAQHFTIQPSEPDGIAGLPEYKEDDMINKLLEVDIILKIHKNDSIHSSLLQVEKGKTILHIFKFDDEESPDYLYAVWKDITAPDTAHTITPKADDKKGDEDDTATETDRAAIALLKAEETRTTEDVAKAKEVVATATANAENARQVANKERANAENARKAANKERANVEKARVAEEAEEAARVAEEAEEAARVAAEAAAATAKKAEEDAAKRATLIAKFREQQKAAIPEEIRTLLASLPTTQADELRQQINGLKADKALTKIQYLMAKSKYLMAKSKAKEDAARLAAAKQAEEDAARLAAAKQAEEDAARLAAAKQAEEDAARLAAAKKAEEDAARLAAAKKAEEEKWKSLVNSGGYVFNQRNGKTYTFVSKKGILITYRDDKGNIMSSSDNIDVSPIQPHYSILYNTPLINKKTSVAVLFKNYLIYDEKGNISKKPRSLIETAMTKDIYILDIDSILDNMIYTPKEGETFNCMNGHTMEVVKIEVDHENRVSLTFKVNGGVYTDFIHNIPCSFVDYIYL